jgi:predicted XRE-type DNA-binding protein
MIKIKTNKDLQKILKLKPEDCIEIEFRTQLCAKITSIVKKKNLTHDEVAKLCKASRTRITAILNGSTKGVSTDMLLRILYNLGYRIKASFHANKIAA